MLDVRDRTYDARAENAVVVDTNIWLWITLPQVSLARHYQLNVYPTFLKTLKSSGVALYHSPVSLNELAALLERYEFDKAVDAGLVQDDSTGRKAVRRMPGLRAQLADDARRAWNSVIALSAPVSADFDTDRFFALLDGSEVDPSDAQLISGAERLLREFAVLTDDADFGTVDGLRVLTANSTLVNNAKRAGRLA